MRVVLGLGDWNGDFVAVGFVLIFRYIGKPLQGVFKLLEGPDAQAAHSAEESEIPDTSVNIGLVENGEALLPGETRFVKGANQGGEFGLSEPGPGQHRERAQIQQGAVEAAFSAGDRQG